MVQPLLRPFTNRCGADNINATMTRCAHLGQRVLAHKGVRAGVRACGRAGVRVAPRTPALVSSTLLFGAALHAGRIPLREHAELCCRFHPPEYSFGIDAIFLKNATVALVAHSRVSALGMSKPITGNKPCFLFKLS